MKSFLKWCAPDNKMRFICDEKPIQHLLQQHTRNRYNTFIDGKEAFKIFSMDPEMIRMWSLAKAHLLQKESPAAIPVDEEKGFKDFFKELILEDSAPPPRTVEFVSRSSRLDEERKAQHSAADKVKSE
jgi:hypothetical protein